MAEFPHFALPFRFDRFANELVVPVNEQDTVEELGDSVELLLRTEQGQRRTLPGFGRPQSLAFMGDRELARSLVQSTVNEWEPRVQAFVQQGDFDMQDPGVVRLLAMYEISVEQEEGT
jgi:phage baseplate assembly protein W